MRRLIAATLIIALYTTTLAQAQSSSQMAAAAAAQVRQSAGKNSFQEVTSHLDPGGNLFLYLSTEEWLKGLSGSVTKLRDLITSMPNMSASDKQSASMVFDVISRLVKNSGVEQVSGFGLSSIQVDKDVYRLSWMLHRYRSDDSGYLWSVMGTRPHALDGLDLMPVNTAFAVYSDLDAPLLWSAMTDEIGKSGIPGAREALDSLPQQFAAMTGADLNQLLASLGGEYGFVLTLDESRMMPLPIPVPGPGIQIPEPGLMLIAKVKNDSLFNLLEQGMQSSGLDVVKGDRGSVRMRTLDLPGGMLPPFLKPTLARSGDDLFIATSDTLIESALAAKAGGRPGLKSTEEFKRYSQSIPTQGNSFSFLSPKIGKLITDIEKQSLQGAASAPAQAQAMAGLINAIGGSGSSGSYGIYQNTDEGLISVGNMNQNPTSALLLPLIAIPALAAVAIPSLLQSRQAANDSAAIANLRTIVTAEVVHLVDKDKYGDIRALVSDGLLDSRFNSEMAGYQFNITVSGTTFIATAIPTSSSTGQWGYYASEDGVVRYSLDPTKAPPGQSGKPVR